jgi:protein SCO1
LKLTIPAICLPLLLAVAVPAQSPSPTPAATTSAAQKYFTDVELINQDGATVRLYTDLLKGKTAIINSFYATEHSTCTVMFKNLEQVQAALGDRVGKDVFLISITVDPLTDTAAKLKAFRERFHARPGWSFVTGPKDKVEIALQKLGMLVQNKDDHLMILVIGNEPTGLWKKAYALADPNEITKVILNTANDR